MQSPSAVNSHRAATIFSEQFGTKILPSLPFDITEVKKEDLQ